MSYILDALRRSQAERERGQVPGLDARPAAVAGLPADAPGARWRGVALVAAAGAVGVLTLWWWLRAAPPAAPAVVGVPAGDAEPVVASAPPAARAVLPVVVSAPVAPAAPTADAASPPRPPGPAVAAAPSTTPSRPAPLPAAAAPTATTLAALTPAQRRDWPTLVLGGSIWSDSALSRFVIVNGQVVREGEAAAPGVVVERIGPKAVWLRWRDLRVELPL